MFPDKNVTCVSRPYLLGRDKPIGHLLRGGAAVGLPDLVQRRFRRATQTLRNVFERVDCLVNPPALLARLRIHLGQRHQQAAPSPTVSAFRPRFLRRSSTAFLLAVGSWNPSSIAWKRLRPRTSQPTAGHKHAEPMNLTHVVRKGEPVPLTVTQDGTYVADYIAKEFADFVVWDEKTKAPVAIARDQLGEHFIKLDVDPALTGAFKLETMDGKTVLPRRQLLVRNTCRVFDRYLSAAPVAHSRTVWLLPPSPSSASRGSKGGG